MSLCPPSMGVTKDAPANRHRGARISAAISWRTGAGVEATVSPTGGTYWAGSAHWPPSGPDLCQQTPVGSPADQGIADSWRIRPARPGSARVGWSYAGARVGPEVAGQEPNGGTERLVGVGIGVGMADEFGGAEGDARGRKGHLHVLPLSDGDKLITGIPQ